ncbi:hypothetical protein CN925_16410 [Bacillus sp. AFS055030]|nr:hypothetical protein CN925_16410 [Bacillus sp. AFS055030]
MNMHNVFFPLLSIIPILFYLAPLVFIIWFLLKFLKIQQEKNQILKRISDKLDHFNNNHSDT